MPLTSGQATTQAIELVKAMIASQQVSFYGPRTRKASEGAELDAEYLIKLISLTAEAIQKAHAS